MGLGVEGLWGRCLFEVLFDVTSDICRGVWGAIAGAVWDWAEHGVGGVAGGAIEWEERERGILGLGGGYVGKLLGSIGLAVTIVS